MCPMFSKFCILNKIIENLLISNKQIYTLTQEMNTNICLRTLELNLILFSRDFYKDDLSCFSLVGHTTSTRFQSFVADCSSPNENLIPASPVVTVLRQVFGCSHFLFPDGVHLRATGMQSWSILRVCPSHCMCHHFISDYTVAAGLLIEVHIVFVNSVLSN